MKFIDGGTYEVYGSPSASPLRVTMPPGRTAADLIRAFKKLAGGVWSKQRSRGIWFTGP